MFYFVVKAKYFSQHGRTGRRPAIVGNLNRDVLARELVVAEILKTGFQTAAVAVRVVFRFVGPPIFNDGGRDDGVARKTGNDGSGIFVGQSPVHGNKDVQDLGLGNFAVWLMGLRQQAVCQHQVQNEREVEEDFWFHGEPLLGARK